jgi:hypothetical protein
LLVAHGPGDPDEVQERPAVVGIHVDDFFESLANFPFSTWPVFQKLDHSIPAVHARFLPCSPQFFLVLPQAPGITGQGNRRSFHPWHVGRSGHFSPTGRERCCEPGCQSVGHFEYVAASDAFAGYHRTVRQVNQLDVQYEIIQGAEHGTADHSARARFSGDRHRQIVWDVVCLLLARSAEELKESLRAYHPQITTAGQVRRQHVGYAGPDPVEAIVTRIIREWKNGE